MSKSNYYNWYHIQSRYRVSKVIIIESKKKKVGVVHESF